MTHDTKNSVSETPETREPDTVEPAPTTRSWARHALTGIIAIVVAATSFLVSSALAPTDVDAKRAEDRARTTAEKRAYKAAYDSAYDAAYAEGKAEGKREGIRTGTLAGKRKGTLRGKAVGAKKGKAAAGR